MDTQSRHRHASLWLLILGVLLAVPPVARARPRQPPSIDGRQRLAAATPEPRDQVRQLTQEGESALTAKDFDGAVKAFSAAYRLAPTAQLLYSLGQVALLQGRTVDAKDLFRRYLHDSSEPEASPARQEAQRVLQLPAPPPGEVRIVGDRNSVVLVDDRVVGMLPLPLPLPLLLAAGEHRVVLEQGALHLEDRITVLAGRVAELRCQFQLGVVVASYMPALLLLTDYPALVGESRLEQALTQAAANSHFDLLPRPAALVQAPKLAECLDTVACQTELATLNLVQYSLSLKAAVRTGSTADWQLQVVLLDATVGEMAAEQPRECPSCTVEQAAEMLAQTAAEVLKVGLLRPRATLALATIPAGAEVFAGARSLGVTPLRRVQWVGPLELRIRHPGYRTHPVQVTLEAGQTVSLNLELAPGSDLVVPPPTVEKTVILPRPRWRLALGATALGVGVGLLALGGSALTLDGQCVPDSFKGTQCQNVYMTTGIGTGLGIGGALFLGSGAVLLALPGRRHQIVVPAEVPVQRDSGLPGPWAALTTR